MKRKLIMAVMCLTLTLGVFGGFAGCGNVGGGDGDGRTKAEHIAEITRVLTAISDERASELEQMAAKTESPFDLKPLSDSPAPTSPTSPIVPVPVPVIPDMSEAEIQAAIEQGGLDALAVLDDEYARSEGVWFAFDVISNILFTAIEELGESALDSVYKMNLDNWEETVMPTPLNIDIKGVNDDGKVVGYSTAGVYPEYPDILSYQMVYSAYHRSASDYGFEIYITSDMKVDEYVGFYFGYDKASNKALYMSIFHGEITTGEDDPNGEGTAVTTDTNMIVYSNNGKTIPDKYIRMDAAIAALQEELEKTYDAYFVTNQRMLNGLPQKSATVLDKYTDKDGNEKTLTIDMGDVLSKWL